jgi:hypothetical protein
MAVTKTKGDLGQAMIVADALKRGYKAALPLGEDWKYDLIIQKKNKLLRIQCKYVTAKNNVVKVRCETHDGRNYYKYTDKDLDYLAVYDEVSDRCYYINNAHIGKGRASISLRLEEPKNRQKKKILFAKDFTDF